MAKKKIAAKSKRAKRRPYSAPDFESSLAFERKSLACVPATRNASPDFPALCSMQS